MEFELKNVYRLKHIGVRQLALAILMLVIAIAIVTFFILRYTARMNYEAINKPIIPKVIKPVSQSSAPDSIYESMSFILR